MRIRLVRHPSGLAIEGPLPLLMIAHGNEVIVREVDVGHAQRRPLPHFRRQLLVVKRPRHELNRAKPWRSRAHPPETPSPGVKQRPLDAEVLIQDQVAVGPDTKEVVSRNPEDSWVNTNS